MPIDVDKMSRAVSRTLGEEVTVYGAAGPTRLTALFVEPHLAVRYGVAIDIPMPTLYPTAADWAATEAVNDDQIARGDCLYTVVDAQPEDTGLVAVSLRRFQ